MEASIPLDMIPEEDRDVTRKKRATMSMEEKIKVRQMRR